MIKRDKREGTFVDTKKIQWCRTCKHHIKIDGYEFESGKSNAYNELDKIPCRISNKTKETWDNYFNVTPMDRKLYPDDCLLWEKK